MCRQFIDLGLARFLQKSCTSVTAVALPPNVRRDAVFLSTGWGCGLGLAAWGREPPMASLVRHGQLDSTVTVTESGCLPILQRSASHTDT